MSFLSDLFTGSRPDMRLPGYAEGMLTKIDENVNPKMSWAGKQFKKIGKQYGEDPTSLASVSQAQGAGDLRDFDESGMQGANQLIANTGGEQGLAMANARSVGRERIKERTGLNSINEANSKYFGALGGQADASNALQQQIMAKYGLMSNLMNTGYDATKKGGIFNPQTIANTMQAFAGGAGSALGAKCWIAEALYGKHDARTHLLRHWINNVWEKESRIGAAFGKLYQRFGVRVAAVVKRNRFVRWVACLLFDRLLEAATSWYLADRREAANAL
jgi:hypothetical protein